MSTETKVYQFSELDERAKERARERYRRADDGDIFWSECITDDVKDILWKLGFNNPNLSWSGFSSQGDGACFTGTFYPSDCKPEKLLVDWSDKELLRIAEKIGCFAVSYLSDTVGIRQTGRYCHEHSVSFTFNDPDIFGGVDECDPFLEQCLNMAQDMFEEACRDLMRWYYRRLQTEYEWVNADAQVDDSIIANEYEFDEDGNRS